MKTATATDIQPFSIATPDIVLDDLNVRLAATRWINPLRSKGWDHGIDPDYLKEFVLYWRETFDWKREEKKLNQVKQFTAEINEYHIHFIHERGKGPNPIPVLLLHGWPDSFYRFNKILPMLTRETPVEDRSGISFDVVIPSLPGFGFTTVPHDIDQHQSIRRNAAILFNLMTNVLGYSQFVIAGGDGGSPLAQTMAIDYPQSVKAIYLTDGGWHIQNIDPSTLTKTEKKYLEHAKQVFMKEGAYAMEQSTRPQTLAYSLNDSPAALAAWILDRFYFWCDGDGDIENCFTKDELLTNIMIYWTTQTIGSSMRSYKMETLFPTLTSKDHVDVPVGMGLFPKDIGGIPPRELLERTLNIQHWTEFDRGGHFTCWEQPEAMAIDMRKFFSTF